MREDSEETEGTATLVYTEDRQKMLESFSGTGEKEWEYSLGGNPRGHGDNVQTSHRHKVRAEAGSLPL